MSAERVRVNFKMSVISMEEDRQQHAEQQKMILIFLSFLFVHFFSSPTQLLEHPLETEEQGQ